MARTLYLPLKREYFEAIQNGSKAEEYRLCTQHWRNRLEGREYDSIVLTLGYPSRADRARRLVLPWRGYTLKTITHPHFGTTPVQVYAIHVDVGGIGSVVPETSAPIRDDARIGKAQPALTQVQAAHVAAVFPENREQMVKYLMAGVAVVVGRQTECGSDVHPFCIAVAADQEFWIDCCETAELARSRAKSLGLSVVGLGE